MFCGKCGAKNADSARFCTKCGAKLNPGEVPSHNPSVHAGSADQNEANRRVGMIATAVAAVLVVFLCLALFGGRSYKATVNTYVKASTGLKAKPILSLLPDQIIDYAVEVEEYENRAELVEEVEEILKDQHDYIEKNLGDDWKVSHKIVNVKNVTGDDFDKLKKAYKIADIRVTAAKTVEVKLTVKAGDTEATNTMYVSVIKIGRSWYLDFESMVGIF